MLQFHFTKSICSFIIFFCLLTISQTPIDAVGAAYYLKGSGDFSGPNWCEGGSWKYCEDESATCGVVAASGQDTSLSMHCRTSSSFKQGKLTYSSLSMGKDSSFSIDGGELTLKYRAELSKFSMTAGRLDAPHVTAQHITQSGGVMDAQVTVEKNYDPDKDGVYELSGGTLNGRVYVESDSSMIISGPAKIDNHLTCIHEKLVISDATAQIKTVHLQLGEEGVHNFKFDAPEGTTVLIEKDYSGFARYNLSIPAPVTGNGLENTTFIFSSKDGGDDYEYYNTLRIESQDLGCDGFTSYNKALNKVVVGGANSNGFPRSDKLVIGSGSVVYIDTLHILTPSEVSVDGTLYYKTLILEKGAKLNSSQLAKIVKCEGGAIIEPPKSPPPSGGKNQGGTEDPINTSTGELFFSFPLFDLGGPLPLSFGFYYGSHSYSNTRDLSLSFGHMLGYNWLHNFNINRLYRGDNKTVISYDNGKQIEFTLDTASAKWKLSEDSDGVQYQLKDANGEFYMMDPEKELVFSFNELRLLQSITDRNGNKLTLLHDSNGLLTTVSDGMGRTLKFNYNGSQLVSVCDQQGRCASFKYSTDGLMTAITNPMGYTYQFEYATAGTRRGLITKMTFPEGNYHYVQSYNSEGKVVSQTDAYGNEMQINYDDGGATDIFYPDNSHSQHLHDSNFNLTNVTYQNGKQVSLEYDENNHRKGVIDALGNKTSSAYEHSSGKLTSVTNALGETMNNSFQPTHQDFGLVSFTFYDLIEKQFPNGSKEKYIIDGQGNLLVREDPAGNQFSRTYNSKGQPLTIRAPGGETTTNTYNIDGTLSSSETSESGMISYTYDEYKRLIKIGFPNGGHQTVTRDLNDNIVSRTDELGNTTLYKYDTNGNLILITNAKGATTSMTHDLMDRTLTSTNPLGGITHFTYDRLGRLIETKAPNMISTHYGYNEMGKLTATANSEGDTWGITYNDEQIIKSRTTPAGKTITMETDALGRVIKETDTLGMTRSRTYNAMGVNSSVTDKLGNQTFFDYDSRGLLTRIDNAGAGITALIAWDKNSQLSSFTDPLNNRWSYKTTLGGNVLQHIDPLGSSWNYQYDDMGQLTETENPDGETQSLEYDRGGRVVKANFSDGSSIDYEYDQNANIISTQGLVMAYDLADNLISSTDNNRKFTTNYDTSGRITSISYDNLCTVTYEYDERSLLTRVSDTLTNSFVSFTYNKDLLVTQINRSNGVTTTIGYDAEGRIIDIKDGELAHHTYTLNAEGDIAAMAAQLPLEVKDADPSELNLELTYNKAAQISQTGYKYDKTGRLVSTPGDMFTWSPNELLLSTSKSRLSYNGFGCIRTRADDNEDLHFYYNPALNLNPIIAQEDRNSGIIERFYIWKTSGELLYAIDKNLNVSFYHFDRIGSTSILTDGEGEVTDQYTYSPYGQLLVHQGKTKQPFTFIGQFGVRQEGDTGLYQMHSRYYDSHSGRFLSRDMATTDIRDVENMNPYIYTTNPLSYIDPLGGDAKKKMVFSYLLNVIKKMSKNPVFRESLKKYMVNTATAVDKAQANQGSSLEKTVEICISVVPGSSEGLKTFKKLWGGKSLTSSDFGDIAGGALRDTFATPYSLLRFALGFGIIFGDTYIQECKITSMEGLRNYLFVVGLTAAAKNFAKFSEIVERGYGESGARIAEIMDMDKGAASRNSQRTGRDNKEPWWSPFKWGSQLGHFLGKKIYGADDAYYKKAPSARKDALSPTQKRQLRQKRNTDAMFKYNQEQGLMF